MFSHLEEHVLGDLEEHGHDVVLGDLEEHGHVPSNGKQNSNQSSSPFSSYQIAYPNKKTEKEKHISLQPELALLTNNMAGTSTLSTATPSHIHNHMPQGSNQFGGAARVAPFGVVGAS